MQAWRLVAERAVAVIILVSAGFCQGLGSPFLPLATPLLIYRLMAL